VVKNHGTIDVSISEQRGDMKQKKGIVLGIANEQSIAYAIAKRFAEDGASVVASCLNQKAFEAVSPLTQPLGISLRPCNVEKEGELEAFVQGALSELGQIDFVVHSIAWAPMDDLHGRVVDSSSIGFARAMEVSCHSFARVAKLAAPHMPNGGSMVTMSYLGADEVVSHYGLMGPVKAALESLVKYMAAELGPHGIRVHAVSPGPIATRAASGIQEFDALMNQAIKKAPLGRLVTTDEVAQLTAFLCGSDSSGMTGQTIFVDAGVHAVD
jgi:enoyl-[acyl-carrier protein] reductase I